MSTATIVHDSYWQIIRFEIPVAVLHTVTVSLTSTRVHILQGQLGWRLVLSVETNRVRCCDGQGRMSQSHRLTCALNAQGESTHVQSLCSVSVFYWDVVRHDT